MKKSKETTVSHSVSSNRWTMMDTAIRSHKPHGIRSFVFQIRELRKIHQIVDKFTWKILELDLRSPSVWLLVFQLA